MWAFAALCANAQGIVSVGANIEILPSTRYGADDEACSWSAKVWCENSGVDFGDWNTNNPNYNLMGGTPSDDANGRKWYEVDYETEDILDVNSYTSEDIVWEDKNAPFSTDDDYNGLNHKTHTTWKWTTSSVLAELYVRRSFTTTNLLAGDVYLACGHDDAPCEYYLNGVLIFSKDGDPANGDGWNENEVIKLSEEQKSLIKHDGVTENVLAVHVHQNWGGAFLDCGLYTKAEGGLEMGYVTPWTGKTIFNSCGGYQFNGESSFRTSGNHGWEKLYEAQEGDVYTVHIKTESMDDWQSQVHFKSPINIAEDHDYTYKVTLTAPCTYTVTVKLCEMNADSIVLSEEAINLKAGEPYDYSVDFSGTAVENFKVVFDFNWGTKDTDVQISNMSLTDNTDNKELWVGTHYFNYMYFTQENSEGTTEHAKDPVIDGRKETKAWTLPDFDDSAWDDMVMPIGNKDYAGGNVVQTEWPAGINNNKENTGNDENWSPNTTDNTGYWIRRTFTLDKINPRLSYALNVCHDDDYETYVNGHLLQSNTGWTDGKNPKQVHIPASYLRVGTNVIATEIHQNWGGRFYDCGINVEEVDYDACLQLVKDAKALAVTDKDLTTAMKDSLQTLIAEADDQIANNKDAAELKEYAKNLTTTINSVLGWSESVTTLRQTIAICQKLKDKGYLSEKLTAAVEGIEACKTGGEVNTLLNNLRIARRRNAAERHTEPFVGTQPVADGEYYIYNVGEKQFLGGGDDRGTHQALTYASNAMKLVATTRTKYDSETGETTGGEPIEGGYRIETFRPYSTLGTDDFLGWNGYMDKDTDDAWQIIPVEGKTNVYLIARLNCEDTQEDGSPYLLGWRGGVNAERENGYDNNHGYSVNVVDTDMNSEDLESNQWMFITKEEWDALTANATNEAPVDMTYLISNPGFDQRLTMDNWIASTDGGNCGAYGRNDNHADFAFEGYNATSFDLAQEIYDDVLVPGWYTLSVQGYYRDGSYKAMVAKMLAGEEPARNAYFYVGEMKEPLVSIAEGNNMVPGLGRRDSTETIRIPDSTFDAAEHYFQNGYYKNTIKFEIPESETGQLYFGVEKYDNVNEDWVVLDNFRLKYWGADEPDAIKTVEDTAIKETKAVYNIQGQKLQKAVKGVNIVNGRKVVVK